MLVAKSKSKSKSKALGPKRSQARARDAPRREVLLDAHGVHNPRPLLAGGQGQGWCQLRLNIEHAKVRLRGVDGSDGGGDHQSDGHGEVGHEVASVPKHMPRSGLERRKGFSNVRAAEGADGPWGAAEVRKVGRASLVALQLSERNRTGLGYEG